MEKEKIKEIFLNKFDCYAWEDSENKTPAMTESVFIDVVSRLLNRQSDSKRGPEEKEKIQLHNWSKYKTDYEDGMICGLTCGCSDQECKF